MYTIEEMVYEFDIRADRLASKTAVGLPLPTKIAILNAAQLKVIGNLVAPPENTGQPGFQQGRKRTDQLQRIELTDVPLKPQLFSVEEQLFEAPLSDLEVPHYLITRQYAYGETKQCGKFRLNLIDAQSDDIELLKRNSNSRPSLHFRRAISRTANDKIYLYADRFKITRLAIDYVRYPLKMSMAGYENFDGSPSVDVHCELPLKVQDMIIDEAVIGAKTYPGDPGVQAAMATAVRTG